MTRHDIAMVMITMDRSPRQNYLSATLRHLVRERVLHSERFHSLHISDSGGSSNDWPTPALEAAEIQYVGRPVGASRSDARAGVPTEPFLGPQNELGDAPVQAPGGSSGPVKVYRALEPRSACVNGANALDAGVASGAPWILFCEDDLDVCGEFLDSVGRWLDEFGDPQYHVFPFGCAYPQVVDAAKRLCFSWEYPVKAFYGTQCFAIRRHDADSLADYWRTEPNVNGIRATSAFDLMLADWHSREFPEQPYLLASAPSFVQHLGRESVCTAKAQTHIFESWPGAFWMYEPGVVRA